MSSVSSPLPDTTTPVPNPPAGPLSGANSDLWHACLTGDTDDAIEAIERGADPNVRNVHQLTPLIVCCGGMGPPDLVEQLLARGADCNARDKAGWTPLIFVSSSGQLPLIELLLSQPSIDVNAVSTDKGWTALTRAAYRGHGHACVRLLQCPSVDHETARTEGKTAAEWARAQGHDECADEIEAFLRGRTGEGQAAAASHGGAA